MNDLNSSPAFFPSVVMSVRRTGSSLPLGSWRSASFSSAFSRASSALKRGRSAASALFSASWFCICTSFSLSVASSCCFPWKKRYQYKPSSTTTRPAVSAIFCLRGSLFSLSMSRATIVSSHERGRRHPAADREFVELHGIPFLQLAPFHLDSLQVRRLGQPRHVGGDRLVIDRQPLERQHAPFLVQRREPDLFGEAAGQLVEQVHGAAPVRLQLVDHAELPLDLSLVLLEALDVADHLLELVD